MVRRLRPSLRFFVLALVVAVAACFPGARAPNVAPQRTLGLLAAEVEGKSSSAAFGVVFAGPKGETVDPSEVSIVFNRPMRPLELASDTEESAPPATITAKGGATPAGKWRWLGTSALMFAPEKALSRATEWVVTVPGATKALDGSTLGNDYVFSFTTPRPQVVHFSPGEGASHLEPKQAFEVRFNQPVDPKEVERATKITTGGGKTPIAFVASRPKPDVPMLVKLTPKAPLPLDAEIVVAVDATLRGIEGPLPSGEPRQAKVKTYGPLAVSEIVCSRLESKLCAPHGGVSVELSNRVSLDEFKAHVRVEPPLPMKWSKTRDGSDKRQWLSVPVDLGPARSFRVIVSPGMKDEYGQVLAREHAVTLTTGDEAPNVTIGLQGSVFEAAKAKGRAIPISSLNVDAFELVSGTTDELGLMKLLEPRGGRMDERYAAMRSLPGAKHREVRPGAARNTVALESVATDTLLGPSGKGLAFVGTSRPGPRRPSIEVRHASVTDLAISAKVSRFGSLVLVTRLSTGLPVAGATVAVRGEGGREIVALPTDGRGIAHLSADKFQPVRADGTIDPGLVLFARSGDDWTYREASDLVGRADMPYLDLAARMPVFGMLFTDRGIYKAGETIRVKGVFRQNVPKGMETPRGREVTLRVHDPEGATMFEHKAKLGAFGELAVDVPIPATSRLGRVQLEAIPEGAPKREPWEPAAAATSVEVAAYRPAEFKVAVDPGQPTFIRGDTAPFTVRGDYLFGAPMTSGKVRYTTTRFRTSFSPPKTEGFEVDDDAFRLGLTDTSPRGGAVQNGDGTLSDKGTFEARVALMLPKQEGAENVSFDAEVEDLSRQTIASQATVLVHPAEFYVALERPKETFVALNTPLRAGVAAVEPSGVRRAGVAVHVDLVARTWVTATEATGDEGFHYESRAVDKVVGSCDVKTTNDVAACELRPSDAGYYIVRAKSSDRRGNPVAASYSVYVSGEGARMAWPVYDGPRLELVTDKPSYEVGDVAKVLVKSPFKEADALLTIERQGIHKEERIAVRGSMPTFSIPVTAEMWPNAFVSVELIKGRTAPPSAAKGKGADVGAPSFRIGWAEISVNPEARRLAVAVRPSKKELHPGDEVDVDLAVTDRAGKGTKADVAFYAVDEGVLMLTGYKTPDPLPVFSAHRNLSVAPVESRDDLARIVRLGRGPGEDKGDEGGGGGEGLSTRQDFRTTAFFQPSVVTGADGKARVHFKLPDSLTTYRLMAVATSETDRFGFGQESIVTSRPLMARPALPRFLRAGDAIQAGVILTSKNLPAENVEVKLEAKGVVVQGEAAQRVSLPANGSVEVRWSIGSPAAGKAELAFHARSSSARDDVTVKREVEVPASLEAVALYGDTETAIAERLGGLNGMRTDTGGLDLRVASTALVGLDSGVEALMEYPYGCTEQLTSKMVPLVALGDLSRDYGIKLPADTNAVADDTIAKILKAQRSDGAFGTWPDSPRGDTWLTAYALWALHLAKEHGRPVPEGVLEGANRWLRDQIAACGLGSEKPSPKKRREHAERWECSDDDVALSSQAFVLDVLAMTGHPDAGYATRLFARREKMPLFARALLAHAMTVTKMRPEDALELVRDAEAHARVTPAGATIAENLGDRYAPLLDSENRTTAIVLRTLVTVDPKHPLASRLAKGLLAARRGGAWRSTQENAWALLALDDYRKTQEKDVPDFDASVFFGDQQVLTAEFHGRSVKEKSASFSADKIFGRSGQSLAFQVNGKGRLFYEARLRYARTELPKAPLDRGFFVKKLVRSVRPEALTDALRTIPQTSAAEANASDLVLVDLLVVTPDPREQVVIDDPLPAGLEAVQANLATTARDLAVTEPGDEGDEGDIEEARDADERAAGHTFQRSWYHRELHDDRVLTFVDRMAAGMYHYRYLARATTPGRFVVPPTRAECMYEPETFGRTGAVSFEVKAPPPARAK
jgi:alpha-2-macroglobulin